MANVKLISTTDSDQARRIIRRAATTRFGRSRVPGKHASWELFYEHGQWWVRVFHRDHDDDYSVVDVVSQLHGHGVDFEPLG